MPVKNIFALNWADKGNTTKVAVINRIIFFMIPHFNFNQVTGSERMEESHVCGI